MLSKRYKIIAVVIILSWVILMIYLFGIKDRLFAKHTIDVTKLGNISGLSSGSEEYLNVYFQDKLIGFLINKIEKKDDEVIINHKSELNVTVQGFKKRVEIEGTAKLSKEMVLDSFYFKMNTENQDFILRGKAENNKLKVSSNLTGFKEMEFDNSSPIFLDVNLNKYIARRLLKGGKSKYFTFRTFSLQALNIENVEIEFVGNERIKIMDEEIYAYHLKKRYKNFVVDTWIDINGKTLKEVNEMGFVVIRELPNKSKMQFAELDLVNQFSILPDKNIPDIFSISSISFRILGVEVDKSISGGRQSFEDGMLTITSERIKTFEENLTDEELNKYKNPEPFIQSDSDEVVALAKRITEGSRNELDLLEKINEYLFTNIKKKNVIGIPDALNTLKSMEGDCNEHTILFVALSRALGIPSRPAGGVAYLNGRFYFHAWAEVYINGWRTYDPTWGQSPADVGHIRLVAGGMEKILDIAKYIGKLKIEVVEWK